MVNVISSKSYIFVTVFSLAESDTNGANDRAICRHGGSRGTGVACMRNAKMQRGTV